MPFWHDGFFSVDRHKRNFSENWLPRFICQKQRKREFKRKADILKNILRSMFVRFISHLMRDTRLIPNSHEPLTRGAYTCRSCLFWGLYGWSSYFWLTYTQSFSDNWTQRKWSYFIYLFDDDCDGDGSSSQWLLVTVLLYNSIFDCLMLLSNCRKN